MKYIALLSLGITALLLSYCAMVATFDLWLYIADLIR